MTPSLLALVNMISDGANNKHQNQLANISTTPAALTLSQLLVFNSVKHACSVESTSVRHSRERETPFPLYLTLKIHAVTRSRGLIDTLFSLEMCVSYDRLLQLTADIANGVCKRFNMEVVCPPKLHQGLFTTVAVDNKTGLRRLRILFMALVSITLMQHPSHTNGTADSFIRARHVTKTRHAHQVTASTLHALLKQAYSKDYTPDDGNTTQPDDEVFEEWCTQRATASVYFDYWLKTLLLEVLLLVYIRSLRERKFELYVQSLTQIIPWMFALDHKTKEPLGGSL